MWAQSVHRFMDAAPTDAERIGYLRSKIEKLEALACNPGTTEAESRTAQETANKLRIELAGLLRSAPRAAKEQRAEPQARTPAPPPRQDPQRQESRRQARSTNHEQRTTAPDATSSAQADTRGWVILAWTLLALVIVVATGGMVLWLLPCVPAYYLVRQAFRSSSAPSPKPAPSAETKRAPDSKHPSGVRGLAWSIAGVVAVCGIRATCRSLADDERRVSAPTAQMARTPVVAPEPVAVPVSNNVSIPWATAASAKPGKAKAAPKPDRQSKFAVPEGVDPLAVLWPATGEHPAYADAAIVANGTTTALWTSRATAERMVRSGQARWMAERNATAPSTPDEALLTPKAAAKARARECSNRIPSSHFVVHDSVSDEWLLVQRDALSQYEGVRYAYAKEDFEARMAKAPCPW
jgi:hypothetical protein